MEAKKKRLPEEKPIATGHLATKRRRLMEPPEEGDTYSKGCGAIFLLKVLSCLLS